jgi:hypothetical protein
MKSRISPDIFQLAWKVIDNSEELEVRASSQSEIYISTACSDDPPPLVFNFL